MREKRLRDPSPSGQALDRHRLQSIHHKPRHSLVSIPVRKRNLSESSTTSLGFGHSNRKHKEPCWILSGEVASGLKYLIVWIIYVLIGSGLFLYFERTYTTREVEHQSFARFKEILYSGKDLLYELEELTQSLHEKCPHQLLQSNFSRTVSPNADDSLDELLGSYFDYNNHTEYISDLEEVCGKLFKVAEDIVNPDEYAFIDAVYYTMTHVTTIGYGHIAPKTMGGRLFAVFYAIIGVPLTAILMTNSSNILSTKLLDLYNKLKKRYTCKYLLHVLAGVYLFIGSIIFMFLPAVFFTYMEDWDYDESFYYTFITLSTIGFGDYIAAYKSGQQYSYPTIYKIGIIFWIMIALGYWVLLLNFLQKALKRKYVPKKIRVQFRAKQIAKQAEFLRTLMSKVRQEGEKEDARALSDISKDSRKTLHLVAEVKGVLDKEVKKNIGTNTGRKQSLLQRAISITQDCLIDSHSTHTTNTSFSSSCSTGSIPDLNSVSPYSTAEDTTPLQPPTPPICGPSLFLTDLLSAEVVVRTSKVPMIRTIMENSNAQNAGKENKGDGIFHMNNDSIDCSKEVTLPLKEVLGLVTVVANLENPNEDGVSLDDNSVYSTIHSMVSMEGKLPKLREAFINLQKKRDPSFKLGDPPHKSQPIKYRPVSTDVANNKRRYQRRGSALDDFLDNQTKKEYVIVGEEDDRKMKSDPITNKMVTEDIEVSDLDDDYDITCQLEDSADEDSSSDKEDDESSAESFEK